MKKNDEITVSGVPEQSTQESLEGRVLSARMHDLRGSALISSSVA